jgi:hypothetical protein
MNATIFLRIVALYFLVIALEAWGLTWVWNNIIKTNFGANQMLFGHMFVMVLAFKVFFRDLLKVGLIYDTLQSMRMAQNISAIRIAKVKTVEEEKLVESDDTDK